jgi:glycosyltransferase involved in cell wall biosynthesis
MYSLIIPVYKNEQGIPDLLRAVDRIASAVPGPLEVVFVIDGSPDRSAYELQRLLPAPRHISRIVHHSRNFGSFAAIRTGLEQASGPYFAVMAADLQEPPELIAEFFEQLVTDDFDVVIGTREGREDPLRFKLASGIFWAIYRKLVVSDMPVGGVDVFGCNMQFRNCVLACREANTSLIALIFWLGFRRKQVSYMRRVRVHGVSAWTLRKKFDYMLDSTFAFTDLPIKALLALGTAGTAVSLIVGTVVLVAKWLEWLTVPGYAATVLIVLFFGAINLLGLGVVGSYAWRAYENTKRRPLAVVSRIQQFESPAVVGTESMR